MMPVSTLRRFVPAAVAFGTVFALSATAFGSPDVSADDRQIADKKPFQQCLGDATPTTENVPAVDLSEFDEVPYDIDVMDTNPDYDEVVLDFVDDLPDDKIFNAIDAFELDAGLNSEFSADHNLFVAPVEEGAVPYVKDCLRASQFSHKIKHIEENFEYRLQGERVDADDTAGFGITDDTISAELDLPDENVTTARAGKGHPPERLFDGDHDYDIDDYTPDDPLYQYQWHFEQVGAPAAWDTTAGKGATVAVIDTGVTVEDNPAKGVKVGPDLEDARTVPGYDFVDNSDFVYDGHGHGTHVAGTIAQTTDNGYGVAGLAYESTIMPIRVLNDRGFGSVADIADAIRFASDNGADVINLSLGGPLPSLTLKRAVSYADKNGTLVVAAAGNAGKKGPSYPAAFKESFAVAATQYDEHTTFYSQWGDFVDIAAPGGNTRVDQNDDGRPDGVLQETHPRNKPGDHEFALYMGTSMATPHVAAGAAMVHATGVTGVDEIKEVLQSTSDDSMRDHYSDDEFAQRYGSGIMQVDRAVLESERRAAADQPQAKWEALDCEPATIVDVQASSDDDDGLLASISAFDLTRVAGALVLMVLALVGLRRRNQFDMSARDIAVIGASAGGVAFAFGLGATINPIAASFLVPLGAYALLAGNQTGRHIACGVALGVAGFAMFEAVAMTSQVSWIPGAGGILDRLWLLANAVISLGIGFFGLKKE